MRGRPGVNTNRRRSQQPRPCDPGHPLTRLRGVSYRPDRRSTDCATLRRRERASAPGVAPVANEMWSQPRRRCRRSGEMWSHGPAGAAADGKNVVTLRFSGGWSHSGWPPIGGACKSVGIKEAKAHFSELVRAAANGELIVLTDYGRSLAVITSIEEEGANRPSTIALAQRRPCRRPRGHSRLRAI